MIQVCLTCQGTGRDYDQPDAAGEGGGWLDSPCPDCLGTGKVDRPETFANPALNGILTTEGNYYVLSRPLTRSEMLDALHCCQNGEASCLFTLNLLEAHVEAVIQSP